MSSQQVKLQARIRFGIAVLLALSWMAFIFYMSSLAAPDSDAVSDGLIDRVLMAVFGGVDPQLARSLSHPVRKMAHFAEYTVLGLLLLNVVRSFGLSRGEIRLTPTCCIGAWTAGTLYAASDEFHQLFVVGRSGQLSDVCIDASGVLLGVVLFVLVIRIAQWREAESL